MKLFTKLANVSNRMKIALLACFVFIMTTAPAWAVGTADATVVTGVTTLKDDLVATLAAVAPLALGVMAVFLAWKYGRKIFSMIAK